MPDPIWITVPEYFSQFQCKCGDCRTCCCTGWGISISRTDYFRLVGMECSKGLRRRVDESLSLLPDASEKRYARLNPNWLGQCHMRAGDGYCALQRERGENVLPLICRIYPRKIRRELELEGACANSCEKTLELLWEQKEPLRFVRIQKPASIPDVPACAAEAQAARGIEKRRGAIACLQDRSLSLEDRLARLAGTERKEPDMEPAFRTCVSILCALAYESPSLGRYAGEVLKFYGLPFGAEALLGITDSEMDRAFKKYRLAAERFDRRFPQWPIFAEQALVNHLFFSNDTGAAALCAVSSLIRFMSAGWTALRDGRDALIDVCAASFRFMEHTDFDRNVNIVLRELHFNSGSAHASLMENEAIAG